MSELSAIYKNVQTLISEKKFEEALIFLKPLLLKYPKNGHLFYNSGYALAQIGKIEKAIEHIEKAISLQPNRAVYWMVLGDIQISNKDDENAAWNAYKKGLDLDPFNYEFIKFSMDFLKAKGKPDLFTKIFLNFENNYRNKQTLNYSDLEALAFLSNILSLSKGSISTALYYHKLCVELVFKNEREKIKPLDYYNNETMKFVKQIEKLDSQFFPQYKKQLMTMKRSDYTITDYYSFIVLSKYHAVKKQTEEGRECLQIANKIIEKIDKSLKPITTTLTMKYVMQDRVYWEKWKRNHSR